MNDERLPAMQDFKKLEFNENLLEFGEINSHNFTHHSELQFVIIYESFARNTRKTPGNAFNTTAGYFHEKCSNP